MTKEQVSRELAEELRTNTRLRHRLGMVEGDETQASEEHGALAFVTQDGQAFSLQVREVEQ